MILFKKGPFFAIDMFMATAFPIQRKMETKWRREEQHSAKLAADALDRFPCKQFKLKLMQMIQHTGSYLFK